MLYLFVLALFGCASANVYHNIFDISAQTPTPCLFTIGRWKFNLTEFSARTRYLNTSSSSNVIGLRLCDRVPTVEDATLPYANQQALCRDEFGSVCELRLQGTSPPRILGRHSIPYPQWSMIDEDNPGAGLRLKLENGEDEGHHCRAGVPGVSSWIATTVEVLLFCNDDRGATEEMAFTRVDMCHSTVTIKSPYACGLSPFVQDQIEILSAVASPAQVGETEEDYYVSSATQLQNLLIASFFLFFALCCCVFMTWGRVSPRLKRFYAQRAPSAVWMDSDAGQRYAMDVRRLAVETELGEEGSDYSESEVSMCTPRSPRR